MKKNTLFYLEQARGKYVSGAKIAKELGISRMAVSKAVAELKKEGAVIESSPRNGYKMTKSPRHLYPEAVAAHLSSHVLPDIYCYECTASTNEDAKKLAAEGAAHGTVVIAESQSSGRGRYGRSFFSPAGSGLYMSVIIRPQSASDNVMYTVAAALAVRRVIALYNERARIKWVNNIYTGERKVCGILCEAVSELESGTLSAVICGIGINLTAPADGFPDDIKDKASYISESYVSKAEIAAMITESLLDAICMDKESLISEYTRYMMLCGREIFYSINGKKRAGVVEGVDGTGGLVIVDGEGQRQILRSGEVQLEKF